MLWGSGNSSREFLYVEDAADAILLATERYNGAEPVNIGTGKEILIHDLASLIAERVGYYGRIEYDLSRPDGQPSRALIPAGLRWSLDSSPKQISKTAC